MKGKETLPSLTKLTQPHRPHYGVTPDDRKQILQLYFEAYPTVKTNEEAIRQVELKTQISQFRIREVLRSHKAQEEAKKQRREYADAIYEEKIPSVKSIIGKSLTKIDAFLSGFAPKTIQDAQSLMHLASESTRLLRLELGQSTESIEIMHRTNKSIDEALKDLKAIDPFVDYPMPGTDPVEGEEVKPSE